VVLEINCGQIASTDIFKKKMSVTSIIIKIFLSE
jgi:hypothetical protein